MSRRLDIDGLRSIAVLLVFFSHLQIGFLSGGFVGVDVFFVISGYVITLNLVSEYLKRSTDVSDIGMISIRSFYTRRIKRIVPVSFFVICCNLIAGFFLFNSNRFKHICHISLFLILNQISQLLSGAASSARNLIVRIHPG